MITSCFFTGHRIIKQSNELTEHLTATIKRLIENGVTDFYAGGAIGWDMLCENTVLALRNDYPQIKLHLVLPCSPAEQCAKWSQTHKNEYDKIFALANSIELTSSFYYNGCMKKRNTRLTELGNICICYWNGNQQSGTYQTINIASKKAIDIINLYAE